jgi:hypothetical protein
MENEWNLLRLKCDKCGSCWSARVGPTTELDEEVAEQELEHSLRDGCNGSVGGRVAGAYSDAAEVALRRTEASCRRFEHFRAGERSSVRAQAGLLGFPDDAMAAVLFAQGEVEAERDLARSPREALIGLGSTFVAGISSVNINAQAEVLCRPVRLEVPSCIALDFLLTDLKVDKNSQFISCGAIPMSLFSDGRFRYLRMKMDILQISMCCTVSVTNQNPAARNFQGALVCHLIEPNKMSTPEVFRKILHAYPDDNHQ